MLYLATIPFFLMLAAAGAAAAAPRTGEAEVRETSNGTPCFTISEREERRGGAPNFQAVTVYDPSSTPRTRMWAMSMPRNRTFPVFYSMCIPYAGRVQALPQTASAVLESGKVYEVVIDARVADTANGPRSYAARFCLARQRNGSVLVHHISADAHQGRHLYGCLVGD